MKRLVSDLVSQLAPQAFVDVFATYNVQMVPDRRKTSATPAPPVYKTDEPSVAGIVGFTGEKMRGTFVFVASFATIAAARPGGLKKLSTRSAGDWILIRDWAGELANQILGRIKNRLRGCGIALDVSTPTAMSGPELRIAMPKSEATRPYMFVADGEKAWFWFDAVYDAKLEAITAEGEAAAEGDVILF
jgi:chemotaxis protein CheX